MRAKGTICVVLAGLAMFLVAVACFATPPVSQIIQYHLATRSFSELYAAIRAGQYDPFDQGDLVGSIFGTGPRMTELEREALVEQVFIRANDGTATQEKSELVTVVLLERFATLQTPTLRARVLGRVDDLGIDGAEEAVLHSAERLSAMLRGYGERGIVQGYEVEAIALAAAAPAYPSTALAELLRVIAMYSSDRRVVAAARDAAREILSLE
jgi:hypothetical protein